MKGAAYPAGSYPERGGQAAEESEAGKGGEEGVRVGVGEGFGGGGRGGEGWGE